MFIPHYVNYCMEKLEAAGYPTYTVGGCVRDSLLGLPPQDYDLCTAALPDDTQTVFAGHRLVLSGKKHGTVGVVLEGNVVEITTFRTEGGYQDNRHPDWVKFVPNIEEDLARRDFTVNAMAYSPTRGFADPFGGRSDLENHILRAVGDPKQRFREDSLRILRGARFAVKYGLTLEAATQDAMVSLASLMKNLARERVFEELCKLLPLVTAGDLLRFAPVLAEVIPELKPTMGFQQHNSHHIFDVYTHTAHVVENVPADLTLRWAALLHDLGKPACFTLGNDGEGHFYGHAAVSARIADEILRRLKAPTQLREQVVLLIDKHMVWLEVSKPVIRRWLSRLGREAMEQLLCLQKADTGGKGTDTAGEDPYFTGIRTILDEIYAENACLTLKDLAINGHDLMALGLAGREIGQCLNFLLGLVLDEKTENTKEALLSAAKEFPTA